MPCKIPPSNTHTGKSDDCVEYETEISFYRRADSLLFCREPFSPSTIKGAPNWDPEFVVLVQNEVNFK
jgi:hypothetical protein